MYPLQIVIGISPLPQGMNDHSDFQPLCCCVNEPMGSVGRRDRFSELTDSFFFHTDILGDQGELALHWRRQQTETHGEQIVGRGEAFGCGLFAEPRKAPRGLRGPTGPPVLRQQALAPGSKAFAATTHTQGGEPGGQQNVVSVRQRQPARREWWKWPLEFYLLIFLSFLCCNIHVFAW